MPEEDRTEPGFSATNPAADLRSWAEGCSDADESALIERIRQGDRYAFDALIEPYKSQIYAVVGQVTLDQERTEDVVVEVMVEVYRSVGGFRGDSSLRTWLFSVVRNVCRQELRRSTRQRRRPQLPSHSPAPADPAEVFHEQDRRAQIIAALALLPQKYRLALALHYLAHCSYQEVAQIMRIPLGTAKSRVWQGLRSLAKLLPEGFADGS